MLLALALAACQETAARRLADRWDLARPTTVVHTPRVGFSELAIDPANGQILVATDDGVVLVLSREGRELARVELGGAPDLEGLCLAPGGEEWWALAEDTLRVHRIARAEPELLGTFELPAQLPQSDPGGESLLAFPTPNGSFEVWVGHQGAEAIFVLRGHSSRPTELAHVRTIDLGDEARALSLDPTGGVLALLDNRREIARLSVDGELREVSAWPAGVRDLEGLAVDGEGRLWLASDAGELLRFEPRTERQPAGPRLELAARFELPGLAPEIISLSSDARWLLATSAPSRSVASFTVDWSAAIPRLSPPASDPARPEILGARFDGLPTSVALHPTLPLAFVCEVAPRLEERGRVAAIDLQGGKVGQTLWSVAVGRHPDSLAITPDGRWLVVANEGEDGQGGASVAGSVSVIDLAGIDRFAQNASLATNAEVELDLHAGLAPDAGAVEPEFVACDPRSRLAVVSCQENDALVAIDLRASPPRVLPGRLQLSLGAQPDGVAVLDGWTDPKLGPGLLIAVAEKGRLEGRSTWLGQALTLAWLGPEGEFTRFEGLGRASLGELSSRRDLQLAPEGVVLFRHGARTFAALGLERIDQLWLFDVGDARAPRLIDRVPVGRRPEGVITLLRGETRWIVTAGEGDAGPGSISFVRLR